MIDIESILNTEETTVTKRLEYGISLDNDLEVWIDTFMRDMKLLRRSKNTLSSYNFTLSAFREYCSIYLRDKNGICNIDVNNCNDFLFWMENYEINKEYGSLKERLKELSGFLSFAAQNKGDYVELTQAYLEHDLQNRQRAEYIISDFEDFYYKDEIPFNKIGNNYILAYIETLKKSSTATMMNRRAALHKFFKYISEETDTECFKDVLRKMRFYKKNAGKKLNEHDSLNEKIMQELMDFMDRYIADPGVLQKRVRKNSTRVAFRDAAMIVLMHRGGLRASEALNVRLCDIKELDDSYRVEVISGKGNKDRTTYLPKETFEKYYLFFKKNLQNKESFLSENANGKKMDRRTLYANVKKIFEKMHEEELIEKDITGLHIFRHQFGREFAKYDGNIKTLQDILGHSVITTTMIYSSVDEDAKKNAVNWMQKKKKGF